MCLREYPVDATVFAKDAGGMSKAKWGAAMSISFGLLGIVAPVPSSWRIPMTILAAIALVLSAGGYVCVHFGLLSDTSDGL